MKRYSFLLFSILFSLVVSFLQAVPASPYPVKKIQPDGSEITVILKGDEHSHYFTSVDGYPLIKNSKGIFNYAVLDNSGNFIDSRVTAKEIENRTDNENIFLKNIPQNISFSTKGSYMQRRAKSLQNRTVSNPMKFPKTGSPKSLVILINFSDLAFVTPSPKTAFTNLLNEQGYSANGGTGSARDYFRDNSMGVFNPQFEVVGPYTLPQTYSYYGLNDANGSDSNPVQMVVDACTAAFNNGVNFTQYDTDNDGVVDNVFIYYAGHNEAEGAPENTVWPHRWGIYPNSLYGGGNYTGTVASVTFNGKRIEDYACTSELRSSTGANMCGIGTFCHEFGHVLGLADLYDTENQDNYTLMFWDIMDSGPYLNQGRTPPAYSAFERFYLGFLTPEELKKPASAVLENLTTSNKAYLISASGNHNLNGEKPSPIEYFMFENRQKTGWDTYLPGHGMLVTHIYFNQSDWNNNVVNNDQNKLGVDIVEADGMANDKTFSGDPFPGTAAVHSYIPILRSKEALQKSLTSIEENNGVITFDFMGGIHTIDPPVAYDATNVSHDRFIANWSKVTEANGYYWTAYSITEGSTTLTQPFNKGNDSIYNGWEISAGQTSSINESGETPKALVLRTNNDSITTETYPAAATYFSFYLRTLADYKGEISLKAWNGNTWREIERFSSSNYLNGGKKEYNLDAAKNYTRFKLNYISTTASKISIDDITVTLSKKIDFVAKEKYVTSLSDTLINLISDTEYLYKVRASKKTKYYEVISDFSNTITVKTLSEPDPKFLRVAVDRNKNTAQIVLPPDELNDIYIYDTAGRLQRKISPTYSRTYVTGLSKNVIYIIKTGKRVAKVLL